MDIHKKWLFNAFLITALENLLEISIFEIHELDFSVVVFVLFKEKLAVSVRFHEAWEKGFYRGSD